MHYAATNFASTYFENKGSGQFASHTLPVEAQFSSINDILVDDFNKDNYPDLLLAGNLYNAEVETARNDAGYGLLLAGDGNGHFKPVDRKESGFFVPHDVKSMAPLKGQGTTFLLVGCNDDPLQIFKMSGSLEK